MRIAFVLTQSLDSPSGLGRYWPLATALAAQGHEVHVVALHHHWTEIVGSSRVREQRDGVEIHYVAQMHVKKVGNLKTYFNRTELIGVILWATLQLTRALFRIKPQVVHVGKPHPMNGVAGWLYTQWPGHRRTKLYLDCDDYEAGSNHFSGLWQRKLLAWFEDHYPSQVRGLTTNTRFTEQRFIRLGYKPEQIVYVSNGVARSRFVLPDDTTIERLKDDLGLRDQRVILYVGSLSLVSHRVDLLLTAFAEIAPRLADVRLLIVGGGEDYHPLQAMAAQLGITERTIFTGRVSADEVPNYYALATLSVDPVVDDEAARGRSPLKLFESLAMGVPVVTSDVGDRRQILADGQFGILTEPDRLGHAIYRLLSEETRLCDLCQAIQAGRDSTSLYWDQLVEVFKEIYDR